MASEERMGDMMSDILEFHDRETFRRWLSEHCLTSAGVWLLFGKAGGPKTIKAGEALEEALCFGFCDYTLQPKPLQYLNYGPLLGFILKEESSCPSPFPKKHKRTNSIVDDKQFP